MQASRIYLIGFMGSGKSTLGRSLAGKLGLGFSDLDDMIEERFRIGISDFFEKYGEDQFRKIEHELLLETAQLENMVIATGGGTPCFYDNMDFINRNGISVYLKMTAGELCTRLLTVRKKRPLLASHDASSLPGWVETQLKIREAFYRHAHFVFLQQSDSLDQLVSRLM